MKKRILKIFILLVILIILVGVTFFIIDYNRVKNHKEPIFAIKTLLYNDGGTKEYFCFGYKVIDFRKLDYINFTKIGPLWMKYED